MAPLSYAAKFDPFLSLDCAPTPSTLAQSKERKGSNFAIWQPWTGERGREGQKISPIYEALSVGDNPSTDGHFLARIYVRLEPA